MGLRYRIAALLSRRGFAIKRLQGILSPACAEASADRPASVLFRLKQVVVGAEYNFNHVVAVDVFRTDMDDFVEFNGIYEKCFSEHHPTRAAIEVSALPKGGLVETKCIVCNDVT